MKNVLKVLAVMLAMVLMIVGCGSNTKTNGNNKQDESKPVIKVGMDGETPPYSTVNDKGELVGFEVDVWNEIGKRIGYQVQFERMDFSTLFGLLDDGRLDTIANVIAITPEREKVYNFGEKYLYEKSVLVSQANKKINSIKDMDGMTIAVEPTTSDEIVVNALEKEAGIKLNRTFYDGASIQDVVLGRVDLWIKGETGANEVIEKIGSDKLKVIADTPVFSESAYPFAKTEKGSKLKEISDKAIQDMKKDGTLKKISEKYLKIDITEKK